jgi:metal-sulfur cluster biosynthetic enzyme
MVDTVEQSDQSAENAEDVEKKPLSEDNVRTSLKQVDDPEIGINIVDLGLVYEINVQETKDVQIVMTLTTPFCPIGPSLKQQIANVIKKDIEGAGKVDVQFTFNPPWDKEMMSEDAKDELGIF